jgi:hypothetical protein
MPSYLFKCDGCNKSEIIYLEAEFVNNNRNWNKRKCETCNDFMHIAFDPDAIPNFQFKGEAPLGIQSKQAREARKCQAIAEEGFSSKMELEEGMGQAADEEKKRNLTPGTLTTGVAHNPDKEYIKKRDLKKKEESIKMRRKAGVNR